MDNEEKFFNPQAEGMLEEAVNLFMGGKIDEAGRLFVKTVKEFPNFFPSQLAYGDFLISIGEPSRALNYLRRAVALVPSEGFAHFALADALLKTGRFYFASQTIETAMAFLPDDSNIRSEGLRIKGFVQVMLGDVENGRKLLREAINVNPMNAMAYSDLGQSFLSEYYFDEAFHWFEVAYNIDAEDNFLSSNLKECKKMRDNFLKLSLQKQKERKRLVRSREYKNEMRIQLLMQGLQDSMGSREDLYEVTGELKQSGLAGQVAMFHDPKSLEGRAAVAYINEHKKIHNIEERFSAVKIQEIGKKLLDRRTYLKVKKELLVRLAHQGSKEAVEVLKIYNKSPDLKLKIWAKMALEECKSFLTGKEGGEPVVQIHRIDG